MRVGVVNLGLVANERGFLKAARREAVPIEEEQNEENEENEEGEDDNE